MLRSPQGGSPNSKLDRDCTRNQDRTCRSGCWAALCGSEDRTPAIQRGAVTEPSTSNVLACGANTTEGTSCRYCESQLHDPAELQSGPSTPLRRHFIEETNRLGEGNKKSRRDGTPLRLFHRVGLLSNEPPAVGCSLFSLPLTLRPVLNSTTRMLRQSVRIAIQLCRLFYNSQEVGKSGKIEVNACGRLQNCESVDSRIAAADWVSAGLGRASPAETFPLRFEKQFQRWLSTRLLEGLHSIAQWICRFDQGIDINPAVAQCGQCWFEWAAA